MKPTRTTFKHYELVSGMIVKLRSGLLYRVYINYRKEYSGLLPRNAVSYDPLYFSGYNNDLTRRLREKKELDIIEVYSPDSLNALAYWDIDNFYTLIARINQDKRTELKDYSGDELIAEIAKRGLKIEVTEDEIEVKTIK